MTNAKKITLKIIIIGDPAVGKTSLIKKFITGKFSADYRSSIGANLFTKKIILENLTKVTLQLWDIAGQERWIKMRRSYYSGAKGAIIVGDLKRKNTFEQIEKFWVQDIKNYCSDVPIILLANKKDLVDKIEEYEIISLGNRIKADFTLFTSAKTGDNVELAFLNITKQAILQN